MSLSVAEGSTALDSRRPARVLTLDAVNIGLMLAAAVLACVIPIELFAFSYVVLGPLHYLTQLTWLSDRRWFTTRSSDALVLALPALALALGAQIDPLVTDAWRPPLMGTVLLAAMIFVLTSHHVVRLLLLIAVVLTTWAWRNDPALLMLALLLPSAIHIFVFTGAFMLNGALRHRSWVGLLSFGLFVGIAALLLLAPSRDGAHQPAPLFALAVAPFAAIREQLGALLGFAPDRFYGIDRFLGWAYSYHYLNWFSKTRLIGWHRTSALRLGLVAVAWMMCVSLYAIDYTLGFLVVGCIGTLHVLLELPLDVRTFAALPGSFARALRPNG